MIQPVAGAMEMRAETEADRMTRNRLAVSRVGERSVIVEAQSESPLRLLAPRNHGHGAWVYQSSYGGGFVGADDISLEVAVDPGATLFLSSQASSKVYRAARSRYSLNARVHDASTLISFPDPVVCFAGASLQQRQRFSLHGNAGLICVDAFSAGRIARGERWAFEALSSRIDVELEGERVLTDSVILSNAHGSLAERLAGSELVVTVVIAGTRLSSIADAIHSAISSSPLRPPSERPLFTSSRWPWGVLIRVSAPTVESFQRELRQLLQPHVLALLGDDPLRRKW